MMSCICIFSVATKIINHEIHGVKNTTKKSENENEKDLCPQGAHEFREAQLFTNNHSEASPKPFPL